MAENNDVPSLKLMPISTAQFDYGQGGPLLRPEALAEKFVSTCHEHKEGSKELTDQLKHFDTAIEFARKEYNSKTPSADREARGKELGVDSSLSLDDTQAKNLSGNLAYILYLSCPEVQAEYVKEQFGPNSASSGLPEEKIRHFVKERLSKGHCGVTEKAVLMSIDKVADQFDRGVDTFLANQLNTIYNGTILEGKLAPYRGLYTHKDEFDKISIQPTVQRQITTDNLGSLKLADYRPYIDRDLLRGYIAERWKRIPEDINRLNNPKFFQIPPLDAKLQQSKEATAKAEIDAGDKLKEAEGKEAGSKHHHESKDVDEAKAQLEKAHKAALDAKAAFDQAQKATSDVENLKKAIDAEMRCLEGQLRTSSYIETHWDEIKGNGSRIYRENLEKIAK